MMDLGKHNGYTFKVSNEFKGEYLVPIIDNLKVKYRDFYDDYDEVYHCNQLVHILKMTLMLMLIIMLCISMINVLV